MRNFLFAAAICCALTFSLSAQEEQTSEETKESKVEAEAPAEEAAEAEEEEDKLAFERKPYFNATVFGGVSAGINIEDGDVNKEESYEIGLDNLILDFQGGDRMFNGRAMVDFGSVDDEGKMTLDVIKNVSFRMQHPSFRNAAGTFGLDVDLQAGLFEMPFGIETGYDHEVAFANSAIKDDFFGGAFNDLGVSLGVDLIFSKESDLAITLFTFNGANETMLDGEKNLFRAPAFGVDVRFNKTGDFYATAAASLVVGKAYRNYGFDVYNVEDDEIVSYKNGEDLDQSSASRTALFTTPILKTANSSRTALTKQVRPIPHGDFSRCPTRHSGMSISWREFPTSKHLSTMQTSQARTIRTSV